MATDDERRRVAAAFRRFREETTNRGFASLFDVFDACGLTYYDGVVLYDRLADLIDPGDTSQSRRDNVACDPTERGIDSIYDWCFERIEGADGAEDYMLCCIMSAIEEYRHPERVTATTARPVDRAALRSVASGLRSLGEREVLSAGAAREIGDEIMDAIGETAEGES